MWFYYRTSYVHVPVCFTRSWSTKTRKRKTQTVFFVPYLTIIGVWKVCLQLGKHQLGNNLYLMCVVNNTILHWAAYGVYVTDHTGTIVASCYTYAPQYGTSGPSC